MNHREVLFVAERRFEDIISSASLDSSNIFQWSISTMTVMRSDEYSVSLTYMGVSQTDDNMTQAHRQRSVWGNMLTFLTMLNRIVAAVSDYKLSGSTLPMSAIRPGWQYTRVLSGYWYWKDLCVFQIYYTGTGLGRASRVQTGRPGRQNHSQSIWKELKCYLAQVGVQDRNYSDLWQ